MTQAGVRRDSLVDVCGINLPYAANYCELFATCGKKLPNAALYTQFTRRKWRKVGVSGNFLAHPVHQCLLISNIFIAAYILFLPPNMLFLPPTCVCLPPTPFLRIFWPKCSLATTICRLRQFFWAYTLKMWRTPLRFCRTRSFLFYLFCGKSHIMPLSGPDYALRFFFAVSVVFYPLQTNLVAALFSHPLINRRNDIRNAECGEKKTYSVSTHFTNGNNLPQTANFRVDRYK
jgi:hypothetical protein